MVCAQVFGNDTTVAFAGSQGNFQLNVYKPVIVHNVLESTKLLADGLRSFTRYCIKGLKPDADKIQHYLNQNLMLVTLLNNHIGYDKSADIAKYAEKHDVSLKEACLTLGYASDNEFDTWMDIQKMV